MLLFILLIFQSSEQDQLIRFCISYPIANTVGKQAQIQFSTSTATDKNLQRFLFWINVLTNVEMHDKKWYL